MNTNYEKPLWSHEEGIQHLTLGQLRPQLGFIKQERTVLPLVEIGRQNGFTAQTHHIHHCVTFSAFYKQQLDFMPVLTIAVSVISASEIQPTTYDYTDVFPPPSLSSQHIIYFCAFFSLIAVPHLRALQCFALLK